MNDFSTFTWGGAAESEGIKYRVQCRNDSCAHCVCSQIKCMDCNHRVFGQLLYSGYAGSYTHLLDLSYTAPLILINVLILPFMQQKTKQNKTSLIASINTLTSCIWTYACLMAILYLHFAQLPSDWCLFRKESVVADRRTESHKWFCVCLCFSTPAKLKPKF